MTVLLELFWSFLKIGFTSFGGLSMIPLISAEMISHGWMTQSQVSDILAIAEMTPGPLGLNCATFAGMNAAGVAGAIVANLGVLFPSFTLCVVVAAFLERFKQSSRMEQIMTGVRPASVGMICGVVISLGLENYVADMKPQLISIAIGVLDFVLLKKLRLSIPVVILISAGLGVLFFGILKF